MANETTALAAPPADTQTPTEKQPPTLSKDCIWLEVANVRFTATGTSMTIEVQLRGEQFDGPVSKPWWTVQGSDSDVVKNLTKVLVDALDKRRRVLAKLTFSSGGVTEVAVQYADLDSR